MFRHLLILIPLVFAASVLTFAGCQETDARAKADIDKHRSQLLLTEEPDGAQVVLDVRDEMPHERQFVVVGRVGGRPNPLIPGEAKFFLADPSLVLASDGKHDCTDPGCAYCSKSADVAQKRMVAVVQFVDSQGNAVPVGAKDLFDIKENDMVVVRGTAKKVDDWLVISADGLYVRR